MSLSRRQFIFALSAGVAGGMQFDRFGDDAADAVASGPTNSATRSTSSEPRALRTAAVPAEADAAETLPTVGPESGSSAIPDPDDDALAAVSSKRPGPDTVADPVLDTPQRTPSLAASEWAETDADTIVADEIGGITPPDGAAQALQFSGASLAGWRTVLGDARHTAAGLAQVNGDDVVTTHGDDRSTLVANQHGRGVMAHNTTYFRRVDDHALNTIHRASAEFRTPVTPQPISGLANGQTVEMALFVWDGKGSRCDIGLAFQWMINPWSEYFGAVRTWTSEGTKSNWSVDPITSLAPTDTWQRVEMELHPTERKATLLLNGEPVHAQCTETKKPDNWAYKTAAAVSLELISIWPGDRVEAPTTSVECRNWSWDWTPAS